MREHHLKMREHHPRWVIRAEIKAACSEERGGDRKNGNLYSAFGKIIMYHHYRMAHPAYEQIYADKIAEVAEQRATQARNQSSSRARISDFFSPAGA